MKLCSTLKIFSFLIAFYYFYVTAVLFIINNSLSVFRLLRSLIIAVKVQSLFVGHVQ